MNRSTEQKLDLFRRHVLKSIGRFEIDLPAVNDRGERQVIVAHEEEPFSVLCSRLRNAGGYANVFVLTSGGAVMLPVFKEECALPVGNPVRLAMYDHAESSIGMFLEFVRQHPEGVALTIRTARANHQGVAEKLRDLDSLVAA